MDLSNESLLNLSWSDLSWFQQHSISLNEETVLPYFCQIGNPFYDRSSLNEHIYSNHLPAEAMNNSIGIEYALIHRQETVLFRIRKQYRLGPNEVRPLQEYYVISPGHIYQSPDAAAIITHRLLTAVHHLGKAFDEASQKAAYHPSSGYYWKSSSASDDLARKDSSKEKIVTQTQRVRFETIFPNFHDRFRARLVVGPSNNVVTNPAVSTADANLPRREERTPSDLNSTAVERPMIEVKKQKTQK